MDFEAVLNVLISGKVRFVVVGGVAMSLHGSAAVTNDLDIVYARDSINIRRLVRALAKYSPKLRTAKGPVPFRFDEQTIQNGLNFTLDTSIGFIDLLGEIAGVGDFHAVERESKVIEQSGRALRFLDLPALIRAKRATGRLKDRLALPELEALNELQQRPQ